MKLILSIFFSVALGLLLSYINYGNLSSTLFFSALLMPAAVFAILLMSKNKEIAERKKIEDEIIDSLYIILYQKRNKETTISAIKKAINSTKGTSKKILEQAMSKILLGQNSKILYSDISSSSSIAKLIKIKEIKDKRNLSSLGGSIQRYATLNLFISTIIPSFAVFLFIGAAIVDNSNSSLLLVSIILLVFLPLLYLFSNSLLFRRYLE